MDKTENFLESAGVALFKLYINNLRWTAGAIKNLADVVTGYGNKVYNVRFDKLFQSELEKYVENNPVELDKWRGVKPYVSVSEFNTKKLEINLYGLRSSVYGGKDYYGNDRYENFPSSYSDMRIAYHWTDYPTLYSWASKEVREKELLYHSELTSPEYFYIDDNDNIRIHSKNLAALLVNESKETLEKADLLSHLLEVGDDGLTGIERDIKDWERIKKEADILRDRLSCAERDFFGIKAYAQWS
jgi:hypothetical protein